MPAVEVATDTKRLIRAPAKKGRAAKKRRKPKLFISYRRKASADISGRLRDRLIEKFGSRYVIRDIDSFPAGRNFEEFILAIMPTCSHLFLLIDENCLKRRPRKQAGDEPDWFIFEARAALACGITIIPILLNGASMPRASQLTEDLRILRKLHAVTLSSGRDFHDDVARIIDELL